MELTPSAMIKAIIADRPTHEVLDCASRRLKASREELFDAVQGELTTSHRFVLAELMSHIEDIEARIGRFAQQLITGLADHRNALALLQTIPGIDLIGAAMLIVEIGTDMDAFQNAGRLASWTGLCPGNNESAGKRKTGKSAKATLTSDEYSAKSPKPPAGAHSYSKSSFSRWC